MPQFYTYQCIIFQYIHIIVNLSFQMITVYCLCLKIMTLPTHKNNTIPSKDFMKL